MKRLTCYIQALFWFIKTGRWCPHIYEQSIEPAIIIASNKSFRVSDNYKHNKNETVYPNAGLIRCTCKRCGAETLEWFKDWDLRYTYE